MKQLPKTNSVFFSQKCKTTQNCILFHTTHSYYYTIIVVTVTFQSLITFFSHLLPPVCLAGILPQTVFSKHQIVSGSWKLALVAFFDCSSV